MKKILCALVTILALGLFSACSKISDEDLKKARVAVENGAIVIDVRTPEEFQQKHINGAINVPVENIQKTGLDLSKETTLVLYCRTGNRSSVAALILREQGWKVHDVATQEDWEREIKE